MEKTITQIVTSRELTISFDCGLDIVMEASEKLESLSLVSKICTELENHLGINDKDLAEFIIHLADKCSTVEKFQKSWQKMERQTPDSFANNLLRIVHMLKLPKSKRKKTTKEEEPEEVKRVKKEVAAKRAKFPGLSGLCNPNPDETEKLLVDSDDDDTSAASSRGVQRMSSPEKWEIKQLIAAGVLDITVYPGFNESTGVLLAEEDPGSDEDVEIELVEDEPAFLRGQTKVSMYLIL